MQPNNLYSEVNMAKLLYNEEQIDYNFYMKHLKFQCFQKINLLD